VTVLAVLVRERIDVGRLELVTFGALGCFAVWTVLSILWASSATAPVLSAERLLVYVAFLPALFLTTSRRTALFPLAGVLAATTVVCAYGLATRLFPGRLEDFPPVDGYQLGSPIGYWNGLAILAVVGVLLAWSFAANAPARAARVFAAAPVPIFLATLYFTFSRGSWVALALGLAVAVVAERRRLHFLAVVAASAPAAALAVVAARHAHALSRAGASLGSAASAGHRLALVLVLCTGAAGAVSWAFAAYESRLHVSARTQRAVGAALLGAVVLAFLGAVVHAGGPIALVSRATASFRAPLPANGGDLNRRLVSLSGNGRSEYWRVAWREVTENPWLGGGAGSYESYWHRERRTAYEARNAHNLYLETLAELGPLGLGLLGAALLVPFAALIRTREPAAVAGAAAYTAVLAHAAIDWDWQLPAVTLAAFACGGAVLVAARPERDAQITSGRVRAAAMALALPLVAFAIVAQVGNSSLAGSTSALERDDPAGAEQLARRAHTWTPWSSQPWERLGEAQIAAGDEAGARRSFQRAIDIDPTDWNAWYGLAEASGGHARKTALDEAGRLNPLSAEVAALRSSG
jgi:O-antigen ligase